MMAAQITNGIDSASASTVIVGLGKTGLSCARFLVQQKIPFVVADSRKNPPGLKELLSFAPNVHCFLGSFDPFLFEDAKTIIVSPGVSVKERAIAGARSAGARIKGDIALFVEHADAPIIAITGSNGKSTVTTLVGEMVRHAGKNVNVGGNLGTPALELLLNAQPESTPPDFYVLELSSFQLETTPGMNAYASVVLNVSADHMDRYANLDEYIAAKKAVYAGSQYRVYNRDDPVVMEMMQQPEENGDEVTFGLGEPDTEGSFGISLVDGKAWLFKGSTKLISADTLAMPGKHNLSNALAALALGDCMQLPMDSMLAVLKTFAGLPHRMQLVSTRNGVHWYNDSKGTNVGATVSAINGMPGTKILIAGGEGKDADFSPLHEAVIANNVRLVILIGKDAPQIENVLTGVVRIEHADSLQYAVELAAKLAKDGDKVILSPACASFDMFDNYEHRGEVFISAVKGLDG